MRNVPIERYRFQQGRYVLQPNVLHLDRVGSRRATGYPTLREYVALACWLCVFTVFLICFVVGAWVVGSSIWHWLSGH